ncbi:MAG: ATP-binding protein [Bacteroidota bacterium]
MLNKLTTLLVSIVNIGVSPDAPFADYRRYRPLNALNASVFCCGIILLVFHSFQEEYHLIPFCLLAIFTSSLGLYLSTLKKFNYSIWINITAFLSLSIGLVVNAQAFNVTPMLYLYITPLIGVLFLNNRPSQHGVLILVLIIYIACNCYVGQRWYDPPVYFMLVIFSFLTARYFFQLLDDKNEELELTNKARHAQNQELLLFSQIMSHDLKAPLRTINGFTQLLKAKLKKNDDDQYEKLLGFVIDATSSMDQLIDDLLTYSQISTKEEDYQAVDLQQLLTHQKVQFQYQISQGQLAIKSDQLPVVWGSHNGLQAVFHNLIANGVKFQSKATEDHIPSIRITHEINDSKHLIRFIDNGIGIPEKYLNTLFEPFRRLHSASEYEGTGLGLSICKKIIEKHQGAISIEYSSPAGTCFRVDIPQRKF